MTRDKVFISYSHRDKGWLMRLQKMLKPLVRSGSIDLWADTAIKAGADWRQEIENALATARVAVLLVSAEFLASEFIADQEVLPLLRAAEHEGVTILWVYLSPCHYEETAIGAYQAAHDVAKSLTELSRPRQDRVLLEISKRVKEAVGEPLPVPVATVAAAGSVGLERLSERHEVLHLPDRGDGIVRVLSLHLGPTAVIGRCYAAQLREAARLSLEALGEKRVHWVLAWDDARLNQVIARLRWHPGRDGSLIAICNLTNYSGRPQSFTATAESDAEMTVRAGEEVTLALRPGIALTVTTGIDSGRQQLVRIVGETIDLGGARVPVLQAETSFLFPRAGGAGSTLVRYLGAWIPLGHEELAALLHDGGEVLGFRYARDDLKLSIEHVGGDLRVSAGTLDLPRILEEQEASGDRTAGERVLEHGDRGNPQRPRGATPAAGARRDR